jgi:hypothetical protein
MGKVKFRSRFFAACIGFYPINNRNQPLFPGIFRITADFAVSPGMRNRIKPLLPLCIGMAPLVH